MSFPLFSPSQAPAPSYNPQPPSLPSSQGASSAPPLATVDRLSILAEGFFSRMTLFLDQTDLAKLVAVKQTLCNRTRKVMSEHPQLRLPGSLVAQDLDRTFSQYRHYDQLTITGVEPTQNPQFAHRVEQQLQKKALRSFTFSANLLTEANQSIWMEFMQRINCQALENLELVSRIIRPPELSEIEDEQPQTLLFEHLIPILKKCTQLKRVILSPSFVTRPFDEPAQVQAYVARVLENLPNTLEHLTFTFAFNLDAEHIDQILEKFKGKNSQIRSCDLTFKGQSISAEKTWELLEFLPLSEMASITFSGLMLTKEMFLYIASQIARNQNLEYLKINNFHYSIDSSTAITVIGSIQGCRLQKLIFPLSLKQNDVSVSPFEKSLVARCPYITGIAVQSRTLEDIKAEEPLKPSKKSRLYSQYERDTLSTQVCHVILRNESSEGSSSDIKNILEHLKMNGRLKSLSLIGFHLSTESIVEIIQALKTVELVELDIDSAKKLYKEIIASEVNAKLLSWPKIKRIRIGKTDYLLASQSVNKQPASIDISRQLSLSPFIPSPTSQNAAPSSQAVSQPQPSHTPHNFSASQSANQQQSFTALSQPNLHVNNNPSFGFNLMPEDIPDGNIAMTPAEKDPSTSQ